ncbi:gliding motility-associated C-terminal domain-containing protein [Solitalea lacus]|uniref:T9SS type B sorting domain-containing protein n=1 Tax=Solitalea lacus TaxID=2911172 RepID=UPI001EDB77ED|nr:gliding motility-associated C-terminal domain-containing protein [Solitalea lacus]UKJ06755.1 gliding motility-associated C-terminal domain-containing protein [Solitalea lacus]
MIKVNYAFAVDSISHAFNGTPQMGETLITHTNTKRKATFKVPHIIGKSKFRNHPPGPPSPDILLNPSIHLKKSAMNNFLRFLGTVFRKPRAFLTIILLLNLVGVGSVLGQTQTQTFTSSGTFIVPPGVTSVSVSAWGGGGAGGGVASSSSRRGGGGGAGGSFAGGTLSVTPGTTYTITIGAGGVGQVGLDGTNGASSSFGTSIIALGGPGGKVGNNFSQWGLKGTAPISGNTVNGTSQANWYGGDGANAGNNDNGGGGGGSAGAGGNGADASGSNGGSGGSNGGIDGADGVSSGDGAGNDASSPGAGGGGARLNSDGGNNFKGGNGGNGQVTITYTCAVPSQPSTITGITNPCLGSSQTYSVANVPGVIYTWILPSGWTGTSTTNSITVTVGSGSGSVQVTPSNACGNGTARSLAVTPTTTVPSQPSAVVGNATPCQGSSQTYSVTNVTGVTYNWTLPSGWIGTSTTNSITVTVGSGFGNITVTPSNSCGNGTARTLAVTPTPGVPAQTSVVSGNATPCQGSSQTYSVSNVAGVTYAWTLPSGWTGSNTTNSITVNVGSGSGNITVTPSNSCGNGAARTLAVSPMTVPAQPSTITGSSTTPCLGSSQTYTVTNVSGVTYVWNLPSGWTGTSTSNSIAVTVGSGSGNITVTPSNSCGNGTARTLAVTTSIPPTTTGVTICPGGNGEMITSTVCPSGSLTGSGAIYAGGGANITSIGNTSWGGATVGNIVSDNNSYATVTLPNSSAISNYLQASNFAFDIIPNNANINGIQVTIGRFSSNVSSNVRTRDNEVKLVKAGSIVGSNKANLGVDWPSSEEAFTYGGVSDLWGTTWTANDIKSNFGVVLSVLNATQFGQSYTASVDYIQVTVTYTVNGVIQWYTASSGGLPIGTGSPFNPVASLPDGNTNTPGTYTFFAECSINPGCRTATEFKINPMPNAPAADENTYSYDGTAKTANSSVGAGEVIDWYAAATGTTTASAPTGTNAGTYMAYAEARNTSTGCVSANRTLITLTINKATTTTVVTINGGPFIYTGSAQTPATVSVTGAGGLNETPDAAYANNTNAGTATASYSYAGDANHEPSSDSKPFEIGKASSTTVVTINGGPFTYTGSAQTPATVSVTGAGGLNETPDAAYANNTNAGTATVSYSYAGDANHEPSSDSKPFEIGKASSTTVVTINGGTFTYTGSAQTPATVSVTGAGGLNETPDAAYANNTNAGTATASYSYAGDANHEPSSDSKPFEIGKASSTTVVTINGGPFIYTGSAQTPATVSVTGAGGLNETPDAAYANNTNAGTATASYSYAGDANHEPSSDSKPFEIGKASSTTVVTINGGPFIYTGSAQTPATVSVTGAGGLNETPDAAYANNTNAGTATASYSYAGDANHEPSSDSKPFEIGKASSTTVVTINGGPFIYTGSAQTPATVSVTGAGGLNETPDAAYANNTNAGTATASYSYAGDANHEPSSDSKPFEIGKASSTTVVTINGGPFTYTGSAQTPATVSVTGADGLNETPDAAYANNTNAGTATASYSYAGDANHEPSSDSKPFEIGKASSTTVVTINGGPFTYTGSAQTPATVIVTGAGGLNETPDAAYANNTNAGTATASYSYAGDANHEPSSDSKPFEIGKASSTTVVTINGGPFTYTGSAQTPATVSVTGAGGLNETPDAAYANNTNAGTATASYSYAGDANHEPSSDSKPFEIGKASSTTVVTINGGPFIYTGSAQTPATVSVTGAGGLNETLDAAYANNTNAGTATASYSYAGDANHEPSSDSKPFEIGKASSTTVVTINGGPFTYTGSAQTPATVSVTGAGGLNETPAASYSNNTDAGTATASYTYAETANYLGSSGSETFAIGKAATTTVVTINGGPFTYTGSAQTPATVSVTGAGGLNLTPAASYANNTDAGTATASYTYAETVNYLGSSGSETFAIGKAATTTVVTINGGPFTYTGSAQTPATVSVTGAGGLNLTPAASYANNTDAGTATASYTYAETANYLGSSGSETFAIGKATTTTVVTINGGPFTYTGSAQTPATVSVTGAGGLNLTPAASYANNTDAGTATASYTYAETANYLGSSGSETFAIGKAATTTVVTINGGPFTYTGSAQTPATVSVTGAGGLNLTPAAAYANNINAGMATSSYNFEGDINHLGSSDSKNFEIGRANAVITVIPYSVTYDGNAHTSTFTAVGVEATPVNLVGLLTVSGTTHTNAGTYSGDAWSFAGNGNYNEASGTVNNVIGKAPTTTIVSIANASYDGSVHGGTASVTGAGGLNQTLTVIYSGTTLGGATYNSTTAPTDAGNYNARATYEESANHLSSQDNKAFTINAALTSVSINPYQVQYSDQVTLHATITASSGQADLNATGGKVLFGLQPIGGAYVYLGETDATNWSVVGGSGKVTKAYTITQAPGTYTIVATFTPNSSNFTASTVNNSSILTVKQEDATIDYTGMQLVATPTATATSANITLRANILDISVTSTNDALPGDISKARVKFVLRDNGTSTDISNWLPVTLVNNNDSRIGSVSFNWLNVPIAATEASKQFTIGIIVDKGGATDNGHYKGSESNDNVVVTLYRPDGDFITGGGFIVPTNSVGSMSCDAGKKMHFGFNVKFNKKATSLKGSMNIIFQRTESDGKVHIYQIKANAMQSLGVNASNLSHQTANYVSKTNITDITNPLAPVAMGGNKYLHVTMTDNGEPGTNDWISFALVDGDVNPNVLSNLLLSSNWDNSKTLEMKLGGGNIVVHSGFNVNSNSSITAQGLSLEAVNSNELIDKNEKKDELKGGLKIPNVFTPNGDGINDSFTISGIEQLDNSLEIYDTRGKVVYKAMNYSNNWNGGGIPSGTYYYALKVKEEGVWKTYSSYVLILR